jgi:HlyD family secretion protein
MLRVFTVATKALLLSALMALLAACGDEGRVPVYQGYAEGEWLYLSAPQGGYLKSLNVAKGQRPAPGGPAFVLSNAQGEEQEAALQTQIQSARQTLAYADAQLQRQKTLEKRKLASRAQTEELLSMKAQALAQLAVLREQAANQTLLIPAQGEVTDTYFRPGEWVPPGQPVLSLLPDERRRILFFVPQDVVATLRAGQIVETSCDGCKALSAVISTIAAQPEYTPPVIYSEDVRAKLLFRVEAVPAPKDAVQLKPGLPMDVHLQ